MNLSTVPAGLRVAPARLGILLLGVADFRKIPFAEDRGLVRIVFEFEEIVRRVFKKERVVLDSCPGKSHSRLLVEGQSLGFRSIGELLPCRLGQKDEAEMSRIDASLGLRLVAHVGHELVPGQPECHSTR